MCREFSRFCDLCNVFKAFSEVRLDSSWVFGLRQNLQKLIVREEVEPREGGSFRLQILAESLLDLVQQFVALSEVLQQTIVGTERDHLQ